jgi:hypothetical protein
MSVVVMDLVIDSEIVAFLGMFLILCAFFLETQSILHSKASSYLLLMASGSGILAVRAYLIEEWAFLILEVAWFLTAMSGFVSRRNSSSWKNTKESMYEVQRTHEFEEHSFVHSESEIPIEQSLIEKSSGSVVPEYLYDQLLDPSIDEITLNNIRSQIKNKTWWADAAYQINMPDSYPASPQDNYERVMDVHDERREMEYNKIQREVKDFRMNLN